MSNYKKKNKIKKIRKKKLNCEEIKLREEKKKSDSSLKMLK